MNKALITVSTVLLLCTVSSAQAISIKDSFFAEAFIGGGFSSPGGTIPSTMMTEPGFSRTGGFLGGYGILDSLMIVMGAEYCSKPLVLIDKNDVETKTIFHCNYVSFTAGARYFFNSFYGEAGPFFAVKAGDQLMDVQTHGSITSKNMSGNGASASNDFGLYLGTGYIFSIKKDLFLDLGARFEYGLANVYHSPDTRLQTRNLSLHIGICHRF